MNQLTEARVILVTFPSMEEGKRVARELLEKELVKCVNLIPGAESLYVWEGKVQEDAEVVGVMKTVSGQVEALEEAFAKLHPYEVPEFLVIPVEQGSEAYLSWLGSAD